jgi:two-component system, chemotaxis family, chemotaxis protein CheY
LKILIVDDQQNMRNYLEGLLSGLGYGDIIQAQDGLDAWSKIEYSLSSNVPIGLIISDFMMPNMNGHELLKKVRSCALIYENQYKNLFIKKIPFIIATAEGDMKSIINIIESGVSSYIVKPFDKNMLKEQIDIALTSKLNED